MRLDLYRAGFSYGRYDSVVKGNTRQGGLKMQKELRDELEVPGHVLAITVKTKAQWIQQAEEAMARAEKYGASTPNQMNDKDRADLREALKALGQDVRF